MLFLNLNENVHLKLLFSSLFLKNLIDMLKFFLLKASVTLFKTILIPRQLSSFAPPPTNSGFIVGTIGELPNWTVIFYNFIFLHLSKIKKK